MSLYLKTLLFFIVGLISASIVSGISYLFTFFIGDYGPTAVFYLIWGAVTLYPLYENLFIKIGRDSDDENLKIKGYIHYLKTRRFITFVRVATAFLCALIIAAGLTAFAEYIDMDYGEGDHGKNTAGNFFLGMLGVFWIILFQFIKFGLNKELCLVQKDDMLISIEEYNKIEYAITAINNRRRLIIFLLIVASALALGITTYFPDSLLFLILILVIIVAAMYFGFGIKIRAKDEIFPEIEDTSHLEIVMSKRFSNPENIKRKQIKPRRSHPILKEKMAEMYTDSYLEYPKGALENADFRLWEISNGLNTYLAISVILDKPIETPVYLSTNALNLDDTKEIPNSSVQFGDVFKIYSNDNVLAYNFMSPVVQENFLKLIANVNAFNFKCSVQQDEMLLIMRCGGDIFELCSLFKPITLHRVNQAIAEIRLVRGFPELLSF